MLAEHDLRVISPSCFIITFNIKKFENQDSVIKMVAFQKSRISPHDIRCLHGAITTALASVGFNK